jgi:hypothetical protein
VRYGLVRQIEGHAPVALERRRLEKAGCDVLLEEGPPTRAALRAQWGWLFNLKAGDELLVCSLDTLQMPTGRLVLLFRKFDQTGVVLKIVSDDGVTTLGSSSHMRSLLALLSANEAQRPDPRRAPARRRPFGKPLSRFQVRYANELRRHGASLRMISQLFQISPADLLLSLDKAGGHSEVQEVVVSLHERRARRF